MSEFPPSIWPALLVAVPIFFALGTVFAGARGRGWIGLAGSAATAVVAALAVAAAVREGGLSHTLGGWKPPLGILLRMDPLATVFIAMTALTGLVVAWYAAIYLRIAGDLPPGVSLFWPLWLMLWAGLNGLFLSNDLFNLFVAIEVVGISAVGLAILNGKAPALVAGLRYLLAAITGSMAYLFGVALLFGGYGTMDLTLLAAAIEPGATTVFALVLMTLGLMVKSAFFPLHFWLPPAHGSALPPVSALLSALVVKGSFYILLRLWAEVFGVSLTFAAGQLVGVCGAVAVVWGSWQALNQDRLKLIVAHSSVAQLGYLLMVFPLLVLAPGTAVAAADWLSPAWTAAVYQTLSHALAKASLFLAAGVIVIAAGHDRRESLLDLVARRPMTAFAIGLAGISLTGLPPSGGFFAKWMLLKAALSSGQWWWAPAVLAGSFLTAGYVFMILRLAFAPGGRDVTNRPVPRGLEVASLLLAVGAFLIVIPSEAVIRFLETAAPFGSAIVPGEGGVTP